MSEATGALLSIPYQPTMLRRDEDATIRMIQKYYQRHGLPDLTTAEVRVALRGLTNYNVGPEFIIGFAADALDIELPTLKKEFQKVMEARSQHAATQPLSRKAEEAFDIYWQLWLHSVQWTERRGDSLEADIQHIIRTLTLKYKPWNA